MCRCPLIPKLLLRLPLALPHTPQPIGIILIEPTAAIITDLGGAPGTDTLAARLGERLSAGLLLLLLLLLMHHDSVPPARVAEQHHAEDELDNQQHRPGEEEEE